jgi:O-antigen/teichoic acid export membrane protein
MKEPGNAMKRALLSRSAFIFAIRFFPLAATAAVGIAFSHLLTKELNGIYVQLWVFIAVFIAIACFGLPPLMLTHTSNSVDGWLSHLTRRNLLLAVLWLSALATILVVVFLRQEAFNPWVAAAIFFAQVWVLLAETYLIIHQKFIAAVIVSVLYALAFCIIHYLFLQGHLRLTDLLWLVALASVLRALPITLIGIAGFRRRHAGASGTAMPSPTKKQWTQLGIYDISQVAFRWVDKVIVSAMMGPALFSIYFNGTQDIPFMATLLGAAGNGLLQQMAVGEKTTEARIKLINLTGALLARIVFPIFFFLFFFRHEFIVFVFSSKYLPSVPLFAISVVSLLLRAYNFTSILQHLNQVKIINWGALLDITIALLLAYPLFLWKGLSGVAFAFMLSSFIQAGFYLYQTSSLLHVSPLRLIPWRQWLLMLIIFGTVAIGLHKVLASYFSLKHTLLLGFAGTAVVIAAAMSPVVFSKKAHG